MTSRLQLAVLASLGVLWFAQHGVAKEMKIIKISAGEHVGQWAVEEATGRIFASLPDAGEVAEYDPATGQVVRKFLLPGGPTQMILKAHWLVAACPSSIGLIDLKTNKAGERIKLVGPVNGIFCSKADNPFAYAILQGDLGPRGVEVVQIDCARQAVRKRLPYTGSRGLQHAVMSVDGRWLLGNGGRNISPSGASLIAVDEDAGTLKLDKYMHESFGQFAADPSGRWWVLGNMLYPLSLSDAQGTLMANRSPPERSFAGSPVAIHPARDLAVSVSAAGDALTFQAFSDGGNSKSIDLQSGESAAQAVETPQSVGPRSRRPVRGAVPRGTGAPQRAGEVCLAFDLANDRVIFGTGDTAYVLYAAEELAARPKRLAIAGAPAMKIIMEETRRVRLAVADGGTAKWKIESGPPFAKLEGDELVVAPAAADLGHYDIGVKAARGDLSDSTSIAVDVGMPARDFAFHIERMAIDPAGKSALVWGRKIAQRPGNYPNAALEPTEFALVDLDNLKVLAEQTVKSGVQLACLDDKYIYMALASGNVLYRLDRGDLSKRTRLFLSGQPTRIECLPGGNIAVKLAGTGPFNTTQVFDRETLARNPNHFAETDAMFNPNETPWIAEPGMEGTLIFREKIVDAATGETRCVLENNPLPALADAVVRENYMPGRESRTAIWARTLIGATLASAQGSRIADLRGISAISPFAPLAACVRLEQESRRVKKVLDFHEIKAGEVIRSVELGEAEQRQGIGVEFYGGYPSSPLQFTKDKVVYCDGNRLYDCPISEDLKKKAAVPLALKFPKIPVASVESAVEIQFATFSDNDKPTYSLAKEYDGLAIDAALGKLKIDLPKIWKNYLAGGARPANPFNNFIAPGVKQPDMRAIFQRLTGTALGGGKTAFRLPVRVGVTNNAGESDELRLSLIVVAPQAEVDKITARQQAEMAAQQAKAREEMQRRQGEMNRLNAARLSQGAAAGSDADRINQLENRVRRLEASLDAVLQKLDRLERARNSPEKRDAAPPAEK